MENWEWIAFALAAGVFVLALVDVEVSKQVRRTRLQQRFGREYQRAVLTSGRSDAERRLAKIEREHEELVTRPLPAVARERYLAEWRQAEARFVSDPRDAARAAERVMRRVLEDRGYPLGGDMDEQVAHIAVDHPDVVDRYRHGLRALERVDGDASTEDLRKVMLDFRFVLEQVLEGARRAA